MSMVCSVVLFRKLRGGATGVSPAMPPTSPKRVSRRSDGFTLLELLVVVAIIGLLAAYVGPKYFGQLGKSEQALARAQIESFHRALASYRLDIGQFPSTEEGLGALVTEPSVSTKWAGPYLSKSLPSDPWGRPYVYRAPGTKGDYDLMSYGKDGQPGGSADAADVSSD
jgi:general secretion pathway protein G